MTSVHYTSTVFADERNALGVISCVGASGVNIARAATNGRIPATDEEVLGLRRDSADLSGGQTLPSIADGMQKRYGFTGTLTSDWASLRDGLAAKRWFIVVGWYQELPARLRNVGQANVFHAITVGPRSGKIIQFVDSLQRGTVESRAMTIDELNHFASSGGFDALGIDEFSHAPKHWRVSFNAVPFPRLPFFVYTKSFIVWTRQRRWGRKWSYDCSAPVHETVMGQKREIVKVLEGPFKGRFLEVGGRIKATEELA